MKKFLHEFLKYRDGHIHDNGWWEIVGDKLYNEAGGYHYYIPEENDIIVEVNDWEDLDWSFLIDNTQPYGWIDLQGNFYGCKYMEHELLAEKYFKATDRYLELKGYVKVFRGYDCLIEYYVYRNLTEKQKQKLLELGIRL